jgi:hypothetical protein
VRLVEGGNRRPLARLAEEPPVHFVSALAVGAYAWILHGLGGGILALSLLIISIGLTNMAILAAGGSAVLIRVSRWGWLAVVLASLIVVGRPAAEKDCSVATSPFWRLPQLAFCSDDKPPAGESSRAKDHSAEGVADNRFALSPDRSSQH